MTIPVFSANQGKSDRYLNNQVSAKKELKP